MGLGVDIEYVVLNNEQNINKIVKVSVIIEKFRWFETIFKSSSNV